MDQPEKTNTNNERLKELYFHYGLNKEDIYKHPKFGFAIVTRTGIEKIMSKDNIQLEYEVVKCEVDFAAVKCTATMENEKGSYYLEMAEKRSKARAVLQITQFYSLGVYSEVESDEFKNTAK